VSWFQQLQTMFPNAKLGMGEWGYTQNNQGDPAGSPTSKSRGNLP
jgi:hypothetical protein